MIYVPEEAKKITELGHAAMRAKNYENAEKHFRDAYEAGDVEALSYIGQSLYRQEKYAEARIYFERALKEFDADLLSINSPHTWIGMMYEFGNGEEQDFEKATREYLLAYRDGHYIGMSHICEMSKKMTLEEMDKCHHLYDELLPNREVPGVPSRKEMI